MKKFNLSVLAALTVMFMACESGYDPDDFAGPGDEDSEGSVVEEGAVNMTFNIVSVEQVDFENTTSSTSATELSEVCTRIDFAAFSESDSKTTYSQTSDDDDDFGTLSVSLAEGTNRIVILAHNGTGKASIYRPDSIRFTNNKVTDTFYYYAEITATEGGSYNVTLTRSVAMFRLIVTDDTPDDVAQMEFYYTGGSSTFDATQGLGIVQSRQTETRDVESTAYSGESEYEIYTFPHSTDDYLNITVTALDASGNELLEREFEDVPVTINTITQYTGEFFSEITESSSSTFSIIIDSEWNKQEYTY